MVVNTQRTSSLIKWQVAVALANIKTLMKADFRNENYKKKRSTTTEINNKN